MKASEVFGTEDQQALLRRGRALHALLKDDPRYTYYGRTVALGTREDGDLSTLLALARVQGNTNYAALLPAQATALAEDVTAAGYVPVIYDKWEADGAALKIARKIIASVPLPQDITITRFDAATPEAQIAAFAETALACGVLPSHGDALRGTGVRSVCLAAQDPSGTVVACAASAAYAHPTHPTLGHQAWWGMLATHPTRRGEKLALVLGAHAMVAMQERHGFESFMTGVESGNAPSEAVCARIGLERRGRAILGCADPLALRSGRMTK